MEFLKPTQIPDSLEPPDSQNEIDKEYLRLKSQQTKNITQSFEDAKDTLLLIEDVIYPFYEIVPGANFQVFNNSQNEKLEISFTASKINLDLLNSEQVEAFFDLERRLKILGITEKLYTVSDFKITRNMEDTDLFDNKVKIFAPIQNYSEKGYENFFKRALSSTSNTDAKIIYSGLPLNSVLSFLILYHEQGHILNTELLSSNEKKVLKSSRRTKPEEQTVTEKVDVLIDERSASAYAIKKVKKIAKFFETDPVVLSKIIHFFLSSYISEQEVDKES